VFQPNIPSHDVNKISRRREGTYRRKYLEGKILTKLLDTQNKRITKRFK